MIAALLHRETSHDTSNTSTNTNTANNNTSTTTYNTNTITTSTTATTTTTISPTIHKNRILLCAPSNSAVDELLTKLTQNGLPDRFGQLQPVKLIRMGDSTSDCPPHIKELSLEYQTERKIKDSRNWIALQSCCEKIECLYKDIDNLEYALRNKKNNHNNNSNSKYNVSKPSLNSTYQPKVSSTSKTLTTGTTTTTNIKEIETELKQLRNDMYQLKKERNYILSAIDRYRIEIRRNLIYDAEIVVSTLSSSGKQIFLDHIIRDDLRFETALIDEAAQATEPSTLIPLRYL